MTFTTESIDWLACLIATHGEQRARLDALGDADEDPDATATMLAACRALLARLREHSSCPCGDPNCPRPGDCDAMCRDDEPVDAGAGEIPF